MSVLDTYAVGLTAEEITNNCERLAGNPKLNLFPGTQLPPTAGAQVAGTFAYIWLNQILQELYQNHEWPFSDGAATVIIGAVENDLPRDFLRVRFQDPLFLLDTNNQRPRVSHLAPEQFWARSLSTSPGRPVVFTTQKLNPPFPSTGSAAGGQSSIYVDPPPDRTYLGELHYRRGAARISDRTQVPLFPSKDLLEHMLLLRYYVDQDDSRASGLAGDNGAIGMKMRELKTEAYDQGDATNLIPMSTAFYPNVIYDDEE